MTWKKSYAHTTKTYKGCKMFKFKDGSTYIKGRGISYPMNRGGFTAAKRYIDRKKKRR